MALTFAAGAFVNIITNTILEFTTGTVGIWFKRSGRPAGNQPVIFCKHSSISSAEGFAFYLENTVGANQDTVNLFGTNNSAQTAFSIKAATPTTIWDGYWHMASANLNIANASTQTVYVDGLSRNTGVASRAWDLGGAPQPVRLARSPDTFWGSFDGSLAHMFYYNEQLTDAEHMALYNGVSPYTIRPHALLLYMPLTDVQALRNSMSNIEPFATTSGTISLAADNPPVQPIDGGLTFASMNFRGMTQPTGTSGSWGSTEAKDILAVIGSTLGGSLIVTEAKDIFAVIGSTLGGSWSSTEAKDVFAASAGLVGGSWISTEAKDIFSGAGYPHQLSATFAVTESKDVFNATGGLVGGALAATESKDIFAFTSAIIGTWDSVEIKDGFSGAGYKQLVAAWGSTESGDTFHGSGGVLGGAWASNEIRDTFFGKAGLISGSWHSTEVGDKLEVADGYKGTWASTEVRDHFFATAWVLGPTTILARMSPRETTDHFAFTHVASISGTMAIAEVRDHIGVKGVIIPIAAPIPRRKRRIMIVT